MIAGSFFVFVCGENKRDVAQNDTKWNSLEHFGTFWNKVAHLTNGGKYETGENKGRSGHFTG